MARFVAGAVFGLVVGVVGAAAAGLHAEDLDTVHADAIEAANEAGVNLVDLLGALATTRLPARAYLLMTGELQAPAPMPPPGPPLGAAIARADCLISRESGGRDVPNRSGSGADGPGQYMPSTWLRHTALYRQLTGYVGSLSHHRLSDVRAVMSIVLAANPGLRREWTVSGC